MWRKALVLGVMNTPTEHASECSSLLTDQAGHWHWRPVESRSTDLGVLGVKGVLSIDESCCAPTLLHLRHRMQRQRRLAAALRPVHLSAAHRSEPGALQHPKGEDLCVRWRPMDSLWAGACAPSAQELLVMRSLPR